MENRPERKSLPTRGVEVVTGLLMLTLVGLVTAQVFMRYVMKDSLTWSEELARMTFIWMTFVGAGLAFQRRENLRITLLPDALPLQARLWLRLVMYLFEIGFMGIVIYNAIPLLLRLYTSYTAALEWSQDTFYGAVAGGGLVILGYTVAGFFSTLGEIWRSRRVR